MKKYLLSIGLLVSLQNHGFARLHELLDAYKQEQYRQEDTFQPSAPIPYSQLQETVGFLDAALLTIGTAGITTITAYIIAFGVRGGLRRFHGDFMEFGFFV